ncbi:MAG TPA: hypothetical protein VJ247_08960, partial [Gaiella sp.]|nr:hypothetical protein [Gaiella sp.]
MLAFLLVFAITPVLVPVLTRRLGTRVFPLVALIPAAAFVYTLLQAPGVLAGTAQEETIPWIPQLN